MENPTSNTVQALNASGSSRVHVGNSYSITHHHNKGSEHDGAEKHLNALRSTDPRDDKARIEQTNGGLLKDSYVWILKSPEFMTWRDDTENGRLLWIRGDPGKGKTMLLCGLIDVLRPSTKLASAQKCNTMSFFFCQATNSGLNNYTAILKGLIYLLVIQHPAAVSHLDDKQDKDHWNHKVFLEGIFRKILEDPGLGETFLLVDALDECVEDLPLLLALISSTSSRAKWIATSRNRCEIEELFGEASSKLALSLELHEGSVSRAVNNYISYRTRQLAERKKLKKSALQQIHDHLSQHAHGTFLWVALVCQRLERCRAWEIPDQLSQFPQGLNQLYAKMMEQIHNSDSCDLYIRILAVASTVFRPLTFAELIAMESLDIDEETLPDLIAECGSFLTTKESSIVFIHQSAKDFLLMESSTVLFKSGLAHHQYALFQRCIALLQSLHPDIYGLVHPGISLKDALRNCPDPDPLEKIKYSCVFWADHIQEAHKLSIQGKENSNIAGIETVHDFINEKFLFWLEALVLCQNLPAALKALESVGNLPAQGQGSYKALIKDALKFSHYFWFTIQNYPLQIYASGLLFSPNDSLIRRRFKQYTSGIFSKGPKVDDKWSPVRRIFESPHDDFYIETMTFAPTSQMLVATTLTGVLRWDVSQEPMPDVIKRKIRRRRFAASSDGKWLAIIVFHFKSSSDSESDSESPSYLCRHEYELQLRDLTSNRTIWRQVLDNSQVLGMAISPDNQYLLVCYESLLVMYDISGGIRRRCPLEEAFPHSSSSKKVAEIYFSFSSDCSWVAFHMQGRPRIVVLNLRTGKRYNNAEWKYISPINDINFVPGTNLLMFCDIADNIYLWNVIQQKCELWSHIEYSFSRLAISHSDSWMILGGKDRLIICDRTCRCVRRVIDLPYLRGWQGIAISFDDETIACGSERALWILDANILLSNEQPTTQNAHRKFHISDNGQLIAYDLGPNIEVWDSLTSEMMCSLDMDDANQLSTRTITFSPTDRYVIVSGQQSIIGWDLVDERSQTVSRDFYSGPIAVSDKRLSGDRWVAARESKRGISLWNVTTERRERTLRQPHNQSQFALLIAFASNSLGVLWCTDEDSGRNSVFLLYNVETGEKTSQINSPYHHTPRYLHEAEDPRLKLSSSGTFLMIQSRPGYRSFLWNLSTDGNGIVICNSFLHFSFLDDSTLSTDQGQAEIEPRGPTVHIHDR
ncbi:heterokaryon incompatibility protein het-E-1 [Fusarium mexicanum]|uniref:Heterokaryon incompatibility protein het-E-1 n=1 Tax=Fusarium mexicanum TaxID=751941 RepID=A0A8H5JMR7_9HYPO|nr:heterokaryon incompatibility protein het-E-1 [Fusarium mexicanum]